MMDGVSACMIPLPFRFSAFLPMNTIIAYTLLFNPKIPVISRFLPFMSAPMATTLFWNTYNRCYCLALDWCNRNVSGNVEKRAAEDLKGSVPSYQKIQHYLSHGDPDLWKKYLKGFVGATAAAWAMAGIGRRCTQDWAGGKGHTLVLVAKRAASKFLSPCMALSAAHIIDLGVMRDIQWKEGLAVSKKEDGSEVVCDDSGQPILSKEAGRKALGQVAVQRIATANIVLLLPSFAETVASRRPWYYELTTRFPKFPLMFQYAMCVLALAVAVPLTQGISPEIGRIHSSKLGKEFQHVSGYLYYNRGL